MVKVNLEDNILNIVNAYVIQVGCEESQKEAFWQKDEIMQEIPGSKDIEIRMIWIVVAHTKGYKGVSQHTYNTG